MNNNYYDHPSSDYIIEDQEGIVSWESPSNIALIKYWGKKAGQIPMNPSISLTLTNANTKTSIGYSKRETNKPWINFRFEGKTAPSFVARIEKYFHSLIPIFPFLESLSFDISSINSFPHSSGIASSASSMSALALGLCSIDKQISGQDISEKEFLRKASFIARLGSGSACRSVYPNLAIWGTIKEVDNSGDFISVPYDNVDPIFKSFHDDILIISGEKKSVSSTAGHKLMDTNPYASTRYQQARDNLSALLIAMRTKDLESFITIVEEEALTLHALMMCSRPSYTLLKPNTLTAIERIRDYRKDTNVPITFTIDAGPNMHVLYPDEYKNQATLFITEQLMPLTESGQIIRDLVGSGPKRL